jgi:arylformamidase
VPYANSDNPRQKVDIYSPEGARNLPVVFWIHGGGWQVGNRTDVLIKPQWFVENGFVFVSTGYRLLPEVEMLTIFQDVAKSVHWVHDHIAEYGGDPNRILVMGHSAGAQLAALISIDERYLKAEGLSLDIIKGCVPVDGDTYDVPAIIDVAETRQRVHGFPLPTRGHRQKFGNTPEKHRDYSAVNHIAKGKGVPPFLILHVADHPDTSVQAQRLETAMKEAGLEVKRFAARQTDHNKLNDNLGMADDPPTKAVLEFVTALKK